MTRHKPQPWYARFNPPSWSPKHGRNRQTPAPPHSDPSDRADSIDDRADLYAYTQWAIDLARPKPEPIPYAGVRAGEIIGYRAWLVLGRHNPSLCSIAHYFLWEPNAVIKGDVDKIVRDDPLYLMKPIYGGVYCFHDPARLFHSLKAEEHNYPTTIAFTPSSFELKIRDIHTVYGIAYGTIKCWGEVVEHEDGYRAQYAKLASIDGGYGPINLDFLRSKYNA